MLLLRSGRQESGEGRHRRLGTTQVVSNCERCILLGKLKSTGVEFRAEDPTTLLQEGRPNSYVDEEIADGLRRPKEQTRWEMEALGCRTEGQEILIAERGVAGCILTDFVPLPHFFPTASFLWCRDATQLMDSADAKPKGLMVRYIRHTQFTQHEGTSPQSFLCPQASQFFQLFFSFASNFIQNYVSLLEGKGLHVFQILKTK